MNITDIEDKIIKTAQKLKKPLKEFTSFYEQAFLDDFKTLNIEIPEIMPRATEHIPEMINIIKNLEKNKLTYKSQDGSTYFPIIKFKKYGELAKLDPSHLKKNAEGRMKADEYEKDDARDFALWKSYDKEDGDVFWETPYGKGRPGWHIECSAMSTKYLGESFDIHGGGVDLIFPHHTNEIAQSEGATKKKFVNYWLHNAHLIVNGEKMSKSKGNFFTLRDLLNKEYHPMAIRYELLATHYRAQLDFREDNLKKLIEVLEKFQEFFIVLDEIIKKKSKKQPNHVVDHLIRDAKTAFETALDDDLNISEALAAVFSFMHSVHKIKDDLSSFDAEKIKAEMENFDSVLGVMQFKRESLEKDIKEKINLREAARKKKDFKTADKIRDDLKVQGIILEDTPEGVRWKRQL